MYMIPMELKFLSICYFHIYFHFTTTVEVEEMYEDFKEMVPKTAIFDHNNIMIKIRLYKPNL